MTATTPHPQPIGLMHQPEPAEVPEFPGLNSMECCGDCTMENCVISGRPICAHPRKGGLQHLDKADPEKVRRFNRARKALALQDAQNARYE